jgi:hypothetical protein
LKLLSAILSLSIISCAGTPSHSPEKTAKVHEPEQLRLDKTAKVHEPVQLRMEPAWLYYSLIKFALLKNASMKQHEVLLTVIVKGEHIFKTGKSLHFEANGEKADFISRDIVTKTEMSPGFLDGDTYIGPSWWSSKTYMIDKGFIKHLIESDEVTVKVNLLNGFVEGIFSQDGPGLARPSFREFYQKMDAQKQ